MKPLPPFLFLFLMTFSFFSAGAVVWRDPITGKIHSSGNVPIDKKSQEQQKEFGLKAQQPIGQIFYGDQNSDGTTIHVALHQKIQIILTLPDDEQNGELTHQYNLIGSASNESPLQYLICNDTMIGENGTLDFAAFYLTGGLHPLELQRGVTMGFCVVANQVSPPGKPYPLTFRLYDCRFTRDVYPQQYRTGPFKTITWQVKVEDPACITDSSRTE